MDRESKTCDVDWASLERDILVSIFQKLDENDRLSGVPLVCRSWYHASTDPFCWKHLDLQRWSQKSGTYAQLLNILQFVLEKRQAQLQSIVFPHQWTTENLVSYVTVKCPSLKSVTFTNCDQLLCRDILFRAFQSCSELETLSLNLSNDLPNDAWPELQRSCRSLRQLKLKGYTFYDIDIAHIAKHVKGIKALVLEFLYIYKEDVAHFLKACKELDSFILFYGEGFKMDPEILWLVSGIRDFRIFKLDCYNNMSY